MVKIKEVVHATKNCTIEVDAGIKTLVQYILDKYSYQVIPFACCQGEERRNEGDLIQAPYIALVVRDLNAFNKFMHEVFTQTNVDTLLELQTTGFSEKLLEFHLSWPPRFNPVLEERVGYLNKQFEGK